MSTPVQKQKPTHLKHKKNGRVFVYTDTLATSGDMIPCDVDGNVQQGHIAEAAASAAKIDRRITPFLGNPNNGVLYPYTQPLAELSHMVSIDTREQWEAMKANRDIAYLPPQEEAEEPPPSLSREPKAAPEEPTVPLNLDERVADALPNIEGIGPREAKTVLADWAKKYHGHVLDRRPALSVVLGEAQKLISGSMEATG